jgi:hypothetical protein
LTILAILALSSPFLRASSGELLVSDHQITRSRAIIRSLCSKLFTIDAHSETWPFISFPGRIDSIGHIYGPDEYILAAVSSPDE